MLTLKSKDRISFTVRLNLNNPRHREALERLRNGAGSYTATIVDALTKAANPIAAFPDANTLKAIVREAVAEELLKLPLKPGSVPAKNSEQGEISDEDFDIADDFLSSLGC